MELAIYKERKEISEYGEGIRTDLDEIETYLDKVYKALWALIFNKYCCFICCLRQSRIVLR